MPDEFGQLLERFAAGATALRGAIDGADAGAIAARATGEDWTLRDVLNHLADAELVRAVRVRTLLAEPGSTLTAWDEVTWSRRLHYLWRTPELALAQFDVARAGLVELLRHCDAAAWQRAGFAATGDPITVARLVERGVEHVDEHAAQIAAIRMKLRR